MGRPKRLWVDNVKRDVRDLGLDETWRERAPDWVG